MKTLSLSLPRAYLLLMKPGIIAGNAMTAAAGFALGSRGQLHLLELFSTLMGLSFIIGSACVLNNYFDRQADQYMERTKVRALALQAIPKTHLFMFAVALFASGEALLLYFANPLSAAFALAGFACYLALYSVLKYRTEHSALIGSFAGATPPVIGYTAASGRFDLSALILFAMLALWQVPHFYAIAIFRLQEYTRASIPVLPARRGLYATKTQMILYTAAFAAVSILLAYQSSLGLAYLIAAALLGFGWLALSIAGLQTKNDTLWARSMFFFSLAVILGISFFISFASYFN